MRVMSKSMKIKKKKQLKDMYQFNGHQNFKMLVTHFFGGGY